MFAKPLLAATALVFAASSAWAVTPSLAQLQGARRVLIVSAPNDADSKLKAQQTTIGSWRKGAADRDVTVVKIAGDNVDGVGDTAAELRKSYDLPATKFAVVLIGKDGHVAIRSGKPIMSIDLAQKIDAMPMRRAGER